MATEDDFIFQKAYFPSSISPHNGKMGCPNAGICHNVGENRGKGLVDVKVIPKGSCIFTERAAVATQLPPSTGGD